jgi:hypothetical protein
VGLLLVNGDPFTAQIHEAKSIGLGEDGTDALDRHDTPTRATVVAAAACHRTRGDAVGGVRAHRHAAWRLAPTIGSLPRAGDKPGAGRWPWSYTGCGATCWPRRAAAR